VDITLKRGHWHRVLPKERIGKWSACEAEDAEFIAADSTDRV